jgi:hypothetical protein
MALFLKSEKPTLVTDNPPIAAAKRPSMVIKLDAAILAKGEITLDLTASATIARFEYQNRRRRAAAKAGEMAGPLHAEGLAR